MSKLWTINNKLVSTGEGKILGESSGAAGAGSITYATVTGGTISGPTGATPGTTVEVKAIPNNGYAIHVGSITVNDVAIEGNTFTMPSGNVTISCTFDALSNKTFRCEFAAGYTPPSLGGTNTQVSSSPNVWDISLGRASGHVFKNQYSLKKVLGANTTGCEIATELFQNCYALEELAIHIASSTMGANIINICDGCYSLRRAYIDLDNNASGYYADNAFRNCYSLEDVTIANGKLGSCTCAFMNCSKLQHVPSLDTSSITNASSLFSGCYSAAGAYELYQQMSSQATPPSTTSGCFTDCGSYSDGGNAQIPTSWGGTAT